MLLVEKVRERAVDLKFGEWLLFKRKRSRKSQIAVAAVLGVAKQSVGNWENDRSIPTLTPLQVLQYCRLLDVSLEEMAEEMKRSPLHDPAEVAA